MVTALLLTIGSAAIFSMALFTHHRLTTYVATTAAFAWSTWLAMTLVARAHPALAPVIYTAVAVAVALAALTQLTRCRLHMSPGVVARELTVVIIIALALMSAALIAGRNGLIGDGWVWHSFYNGDTATLAALVQRGLNGAPPINQNPFAGNGWLEYPTLLHEGLAALLVTFGFKETWLQYLPNLTYIGIVLIVPLFFLLFDITMAPPARRGERWYGLTSPLSVHLLQGGLVLYVMALAWDMYVYPQSHFFLLGVLLLMASLAARFADYVRERRWINVAITEVVTLVLMLANPVFGAAAVGVALVRLLVTASDRAQARAVRSLSAGGALAWVVAYLLWAPSHLAWGQPWFSYTAAGDVLRIAPPVVALMVVILNHAGRLPILALSAVLMVAGMWMTFFFSTRDLVVDNASRFFYHATLLGYPLVLGSLVVAWDWWQRVTRLTTQTSLDRIGRRGAGLTLALVLLLPPAISVAQTHDHLLQKDVTVVTPATSEALKWIADNTSPASIFVAPVSVPFVIPLYTGRAILRSDLWLSPHDSLLTDLEHAYAGDQLAQSRIVGFGDYLWLPIQEGPRWPAVEEASPVFANQSVAVYALPL